MIQAEKSERTKRSLLDASSAIVLEEGVSKLTLDAVVRRAGLSRGAIFHHFKNKDDLARQVMQNSIDLVNNMIEEARGSDRSKGSYLRAYIDPLNRPTIDPDTINPLYVIAELAKHPSLRSMYIDAVNHWSDRIVDDGIDPIEAHLIRLTADGLWFNEAAGAKPVPSKIRAKVIEALLARIG